MPGVKIWTELEVRRGADWRGDYRLSGAEPRGRRAGKLDFTPGPF
jgi:hypothetical protein